MEQKNGMLVGIFSLVICVIIVMGVMTPIVSDWTTGGRTENEGAGWLRMVYDATPSATYEITIDSESNVTNGSDTQSGNSQTIFYADSNLCVWSGLDSFNMMGTTTGSSIVYQSTIHTVSIVRDASGVTVTMDGTDYEFGVPEWAYVPLSTGNFGFFENGIAVDVLDNHPIAAVGGGFAGVYAYNNIFRYAGLGLGMETEYDEDGKLVNVSWDKITEEENTETSEPLGAPYIRITHEDDIDEIDSVSSSESGGLRAVPTPTYTDGDWGYEIIQVDGVDKAVIVSYSGTGGGTLTIPATVGGYAVDRVGKNSITNSNIQTVFNNSTISNTSLIISEGIRQLGGAVFSGCTKLVGDLVLPNSLTDIGVSCFNNTRFTTITIGSGLNNIELSSFPFSQMSALTEFIIDSGNDTYSVYNGILCDKNQSTIICCPALIDSVTFPDTVTTIGKNAFERCEYTGSLVIPNTVTTIGLSAFTQSKFSGPLIIPNSVTTIDQSAFYGMTNATSLKIGSGITSIPYRAFYSGSYSGDLIIPSTVTNIEGNAFARTSFDNIIIPNTVTSIGLGTFPGSTFERITSLKNLIYASESTLYSSDFSYCNNCQYVLDLSDTVDFTQNTYGLPATITVSDSIGDCFGYISFTEIGSDPAITGPMATLLIAVPLLMVVGLTIAAMTVMRGRMR